MKNVDNDIGSHNKNEQNQRDISTLGYLKEFGPQHVQRKTK